MSEPLFGNPYLEPYKYRRRLDSHYFKKVNSNWLAPSCYFCLRLLDNPNDISCSWFCFKEISLRASSSMLRAEVMKRDKQICSMCGVNGISLKKALLILRKANHGLFLKKLEEIKIPFKRVTKGGNLMDADHIGEIKNGFGAGVSGEIMNHMQCLCCLCHFFKNSSS